MIPVPEPKTPQTPTVREYSPPYSPPAVATLVAGRNRRFYQTLQEWCPPPGWENAPSILDFPVYPVMRPGLLMRELGDSLAIQDPITLDTHSLNETAVALLLLCDGLRSIQEICAEYIARFALDCRTAMADVRRVVGDLVEKKVLLAPRRKLHFTTKKSDSSSPPSFQNLS